jgi:hypothetical protein
MLTVVLQLSTTVSPITDPTVTATQVNVSCNAGSDGSVTLTGAGGSGAIFTVTTLRQDLLLMLFQV